MPAPTKASCPHGSRLPCLAAHAVTSPPAAWEQIMAGSWAVQDAQVGQPPSPGTGDCRAQGQETTRLALVQNPWKSMCDVFIRCTFHEPFEDARVDLSNFFGTKNFFILSSLEPLTCPPVCTGRPGGPQELALDCGAAGRPSPAVPAPRVLAGILPSPAEDGPSAWRTRRKFLPSAWPSHLE